MERGTASAIQTIMNNGERRSAETVVRMKRVEGGDLVAFQHRVSIQPEPPQAILVNGDRIVGNVNWGHVETMHPKLADEFLNR